MKILCCCDMAINLEVMKLMKELEKYGAEVILLDDDMMQTPKAITEVMLKTEQEGADSCPANPKLIEAIKDVDIVVVHVTPVNTEVLNAAKKLQYVMVLRSGIENIEKNICEERGIKIINAPGRSAHAVADCTVGLMLSEMKNIARGHKGLMEGKWLKKFDNFNYIHDLRKCTVGIIGAGQIGQKVIDRLKGFGCNIIIHDPFVSDEDVEKLGYKAVSLKELMSTSDIVTLHLRLSEKTEKIIGKNELEMMKNTAMLVNTARSGLIDEDALVYALQNKLIGGAALDVFGEEPLSEDNPLLSLNNVTMSPHVSGTSTDTFSNSVEIIFEQLQKMFEEKTI